MSHADGTGVTTPPRTNAAAPVDDTIKSTPQNRGTASVNEHISLLGVNVRQVSPWIQRDIEETKTCKVDAMLQALLQRASCNKEEKQKDLLQKCFEAVLPVCNGTTPSSNNDGMHPSGIKKALESYVGPGAEKNFYTPFIQATNIALTCLRKTEVDGMPVAASDMICHQNDFPMFQSHQEEKSTRKPDLIFIPSTILGGNVAPNHGVEGATKKPRPKGRFLWKDVLASIEVKRKSAKGREDGVGKVPESYEVKDYVPTQPEYLPLPVNPPSPDDDQGPAPTAGPSQTTTQPASEPPCNTTTAPHLDPDAAQTSQGTKRAATEQLGSKTKRYKPDEAIDVTVQTGLYAAEMFAANLAVKHVLNLIVIDDVIYIWYYDRQGIIQCSGINFIQDLPRFMVLLYALQRFDRDGWGRNTRFSPAPEGGEQYHNITIEDADMGSVALRLHTSHKERVTHYGLQGRATNVFPVTSEELKEKFNHIEDGMVAKIFWGEESRASEPAILEEAKKIAKENPSIEGHIPVLLCHEKFTNPTSSIRAALGFLEPTKGSRVLYILVFPKLSPITKLCGDDLFNVWQQCILCHIILWKGGVYHRDISPGNMMWYRDKLGKLMGVLNDYDLSSLASADGPQGNERTGTVPFMALDLLTARAQRGEVTHRYRHDMESFVWVFIWICFRYNSEGDLLQPAARRFDAWATLGAFQCRKDKLTFLDKLGECPRPNHIGLLTWFFLLKCARELKQDHDRRSGQKADLKLDRLAGVILVDGLPGVVEQSEPEEDETEEDETEQDMDDFLRMFTATTAWKALEHRIRSQ